jgi:ssRNA-specific RNase YbeY (16S rRNA maturation enzyme)
MNPQLSFHDLQDQKSRDINREMKRNARITDLIPSFPYDVRSGGSKMSGEVSGMYTVMFVECGSTMFCCCGTASIHNDVVCCESKCVEASSLL